MDDKAKDRDKSAVLIRLFEEGKQFTEDLMKENERLRRLVASQKAEFDLRRSGEDASEQLTRLEAENRHCREELDRLRKTLMVSETENKEFAEKYVEVEQQNTSLSNLYVASYRLHSTLDFKEVISIIKEIVINLIGSETFGIFVKDETEDVLKLLAHEGLEEREMAPVELGDTLAGKVAESGQYHVPEGGRAGEPIAYVPLRTQDQLLGMIIIYGLLQQKAGFTSLDMELFSLIADHAASAIYCSQLHSASQRKLRTMQGLLDLLKQPQ